MITLISSINNKCTYLQDIRRYNAGFSFIYIKIIVIYEDSNVLITPHKHDENKGLADH